MKKTNTLNIEMLTQTIATVVALTLANAGIITGDTKAKQPKVVKNATKTKAKTSKKASTKSATSVSTSSSAKSEKVGDKKSYRFGFRCNTMDFYRAFIKQATKRGLITSGEHEMELLEDREKASAFYQAHKKEFTLNAKEVYQIIHEFRRVLEPVSKENYKLVNGCDWTNR